MEGGGEHEAGAHLMHSPMSLKSSLPFNTVHWDGSFSPKLSLPILLAPYTIILSFKSVHFTSLWFCVTEENPGADLASRNSFLLHHHPTVLGALQSYSLLLEGEADTSSKNSSVTPYSVLGALHLSWHLSHWSGILVSATRLWTLRTGTTSSLLSSPERDWDLLAQTGQNCPF